MPNPTLIRRLDRCARRGPVLRIAAALLAIASTACFAADAADLEGARVPEAVSANASHVPLGPVGNWGLAGWPMIAGLGLAAIAAGAATTRRSRDDAGREPAPADASPEVPSDPPTGAFPPPAPAGEPTEPSASAPDEARAYLALHHVDLAIAVLREHVDAGAAAMPAAWLMLLELYRTHGRESAFRELAARFHARFNVKTPEWERFPEDAEAGLEGFPRLLKEITACWGTHECRRMIARLLYDNRGGRRSGFSLQAYRDLLTLERLSTAVLTTIEADLREEATLRHAFASAAAGIATPGNVVPLRPRIPPRAPGVEPALALELESQLEGDLRQRADEQSALERDHPALADMLAREWRDPALAARLCELLMRGIGESRPLGAAATEELDLLQAIAIAHADEAMPPRTAGDDAADGYVVDERR